MKAIIHTGKELSKIRLSNPFVHEREIAKIPLVLLARQLRLKETAHFKVNNPVYIKIIKENFNSVIINHNTGEVTM